MDVARHITDKLAISPKGSTPLIVLTSAMHRSAEYVAGIDQNFV